MIPESLEESMWDAVSDRNFCAINKLILSKPILSRTLTDYFHHAAAHGDVELAAFFLDRSVDINATNERGETAFSYSAACDQLEMAKVLFNRGAKINTIDVGGGSPLDWAIVYASQEFRDWLTEIGGTRNDESYDPKPPPVPKNVK